MTCEALPIWRPVETSPSLEANCSADAAARKMYEEVSNSVVRINVGWGSNASGFFVGNGDKVMTNAHVATFAGRDPLKVIAKDGKEYTALIERIDIANDLAVIKVQGLTPGKYKPLQFRSSQSMFIGEEVYMLGHPGGRSDVYISPGHLEERGTVISLEDHDSVSKLVALQLSGDDDERTLANDELNAPRLQSNAKMEGGSSGSPVVDSDGLVIGVHADHVGSGWASLEVPSELAVSLLNSANTPRTFEYKVETNFFLHPIDTWTKEPKLVGEPPRIIYWP